MKALIFALLALSISIQPLTSFVTIKNLPKSSKFSRCRYVQNAVHSRVHSTDSLMKRYHKPIDWKETLRRSCKVALSLAINILAIMVIGVPISFAASKKGTAATAVAKAAPIPLWRKILEGSNVVNKKKLKAGDTGMEYAAIINLATSVIILGIIFVIGSIHSQYVQLQEEKALKREVIRVKEYKENMYFDAVEEILKKLNNPSLKSAAKSNLQRELKDLDPEGVIQRFVRDGGPRPDISKIMGSKKPVKKSDAGEALSSASSTESKKPAALGPPPKVVSNKRSDVEDDVDDGNENGASSGTADSLNEVLDELKDSLDGALPAWKVNKLLTYLKKRTLNIADATKRAATVTKMAQRLGDTSYWVKLANDMPAE